MKGNNALKCCCIAVVQACTPEKGGVMRTMRKLVVAGLVLAGMALASPTKAVDSADSETLPDFSTAVQDWASGEGENAEGLPDVQVTTTSATFSNRTRVSHGNKSVVSGIFRYVSSGLDPSAASPDQFIAGAILNSASIESAFSYFAEVSPEGLRAGILLQEEESPLTLELGFQSSAGILEFYAKSIDSESETGPIESEIARGDILAVTAVDPSLLRYVPVLASIADELTTANVVSDSGTLGTDAAAQAERAQGLSAQLEVGPTLRVLVSTAVVADAKDVVKDAFITVAKTEFRDRFKYMTHRCTGGCWKSSAHRRVKIPLDNRGRFQRCPTEYTIAGFPNQCLLSGGSGIQIMGSLLGEAHTLCVYACSAEFIDVACTQEWNFTNYKLMCGPNSGYPANRCNALVDAHKVNRDDHWPIAVHERCAEGRSKAYPTQEEIKE
jgi:hypothetical protein